MPTSDGFAASLKARRLLTAGLVRDRSKRHRYHAFYMLAPYAFALFASAIGECGMAWNPNGVCSIWLPELREGSLRARIVRSLHHADETEATVEHAATIAAICRVTVGQPADLSTVRLDLAPVSAFCRAVYAVTRAIPVGQVLTYGAVAERAGSGASAQAVGQALGANPFPIVVPCHRVIAANGRLGGFSAPGGSALKRRLLALENARPAGPPGLFDAEPTSSA